MPAHHSSDASAPFMIERSGAELGLDSELALVARTTRKGVAITDSSGWVLWVNAGWERLTGYTMSQVVGVRPGSLLQGPGTDPETIALMNDHIAEGQGFIVDVLHYRQDGTPYWANLEVQAVRDDGGPATRFIAVESDITARKEAEGRLIAARQDAEMLADALAYSRQQLELILHGANLGEWIYDAETAELSLNDQWLQSLGLDFEPERTLAQVMAGIHEADRATVFDEGLEQAESEAGQVDMEFRVHDAQGNQRWILSRGRAVDFDDEGQPRQVMGTMLDITERKVIEEQLRAERSLMKNILATIPHAVYWRDGGGGYMGCNQPFAMLMGIPYSDDIGTIADGAFADPEFAAASSRMDNEVLSSGVKLLDVEESFLDENGQRRSIMASRVPLREPDGATQGVLGVFTDVTAVRRLEAQLASTTRLEAIGQLAAGIAHEINTPMQYIGDNTQFLATAFDRFAQVINQVERLGSADPDMLAQLVDDVRASIDRLKIGFLVERVPNAIEHSMQGVEAVTRIVRAMKDFSHPGSDLMEPSDLNAAIETTLTVCENEWKYASIVDLDLDPDLPQVPCYPGEINQVLLNVIVNAAHAITDHKPEGERGSMRIRTGVERQHVVIAVSDDGGGIADDVVDRIFEPFFTTKTVGRGSGQGLAISHHIVVNRHNGTIDVDTEHGVGATFTVRLPLARARVEVTS